MFVSRILAVLALVAWGADLCSAAEPIPPTLVRLNRPTGTLGEVLKDVALQSGLSVDATAFDPAAACAVTFEGIPLWNALESIAEKIQARIALGQNGRSVSLVKRNGPAAVSSVDGAFRIVVKQVQSKLDFESGKSVVEVTLDIHWELRLPVFRIDAQPTITAASADAGTPKANTSRAKTPPRGRMYTTVVRLEGIPRSATVIRELNGIVIVTATPRMLRFEFVDLSGSSPVTLAAQEGVTATLKPLQKLDRLWEIPIELKYPALPEFESFESWVTENRLQLISPTGKTLEGGEPDVPELGRKVSAVYRVSGDAAKNGLLADRKGWSAVYFTPAPLVEFEVRFRLKDIPLP